MASHAKKSTAPAQELKLLEIEFPTFFSLIAKPSSRKKRKCLKCATEFYSSSISNRVCGGCNTQNSRYSIRVNTSTGPR